MRRDGRMWQTNNRGSEFKEFIDMQGFRRAAVE